MQHDGNAMHAPAMRSNILLYRAEICYLNQPIVRVVILEFCSWSRGPSRLEPCADCILSSAVAARRPAGIGGGGANKMSAAAAFGGASYHSCAVLIFHQ